MPALAIKLNGSAMNDGESMHNFNTKAQNSAMTKLDAGPAAATHNMSFLGWRKRLKLTGTGLAQPNKMPPNSMVMAGNKMVPNGSMCLSGFKLMRPAW